MTTRLRKLAILYPAPPCAACQDRPAVACVVRADDPDPFDTAPGICGACGRTLYSVPVLVGIDCDAI